MKKISDKIGIFLFYVLEFGIIIFISRTIAKIILLKKYDDIGLVLVSFINLFIIRWARKDTFSYETKGKLHSDIEES